MAISERELMQLKKEVEEAKTKTAELQGEKKHYMKELKEKWGCSNLKEADKKLQELKIQVDEINEKMEKGMKELEAYID